MGRGRVSPSVTAPPSPLGKVEWEKHFPRGGSIGRSHHAGSPCLPFGMEEVSPSLLELRGVLLFPEKWMRPLAREWSA